MRLIKFTLFVATLSIASPLPTTQDASAVSLYDVDSQSPNLEHQALQSHELEKRLNKETCKAIGRTLLKIGTSAAVAAAVNQATDLADKVCVDHHNPTCSNYVSYVKQAMNIVFLLTGYAHGAVATGPNPSDETVISGAVRRSLTFNSTLDLETMLKDDGYRFDAIEVVSLTDLLLEKRDSEPSLKSRTIIRGLIDEESGESSDIAINDFGNEEFDLQHGADSETLSVDNETATSLHKRYNGHGIKVPYTTRIRSKLTRAHQREMSAAIAKDWGDKATTAGYRMNEYFGLVKTGHQANFYFRIIPEVRGFGLDYESVNACGSMAKYL